MHHPTVLLDLDALAEAEASSRRRLREEPCDADARINLAWCLFVQALHQAGRESALACTGVGDVPRAESAERASRTAEERRAGALLGECLEQACRVGQLSLSAGDRREAANLQAIARLAVGEVPVTLSAAEEEEKARRLMRSVVSGEEKSGPGEPRIAAKRPERCQRARRSPHPGCGGRQVPRTGA